VFMPVSTIGNAVTFKIRCTQTDKQNGYYNHLSQVH